MFFQFLKGTIVIKKELLKLFFYFGIFPNNSLYYGNLRGIVL